MECQRIKEKLSAYMEDQLSSEEKTLVDKHLNTCSKCSGSLAELKKVIAYTKGLKEVEPPPWLTQKVMAKVRQEAGQKKGILQKLFYPLHIKIPVEVIATLAIAVTAFYMFKAVRPEVEHAGPMSLESIVSEQGAEKEALTHKDTPSAAPGPAKRQRTEEDTDLSVGNAEMQKSQAALAEEKPVFREPFEIPGKGVKKEKKSFAPEEKYALVQDKDADMVLTLLSEDIAESTKKAEGILKGLGGEVIEAKSFEDKDILLAEIDSQNLDELFNKLKHAGRLEEEKADIEILQAEENGFRGNVKIIIEIIKTSTNVR